MSININSEAWCRKAYLNYHCYGNSMNISAQEMGEITKRWESKLTSWQATVANDENKYEFDDSDYAVYKENGKKAAQDQTGYEGGKGGIVGRGIGDAAVGAVGTAASFAGKAVGGALVKGAAKAAQRAAYAKEYASRFKINNAKEAAEAAQKKGQEAYDNTVQDGKQKGEEVSCLLACSLSLANGLAYQFKKPNKQQKEACDELQNVIANNQTALLDTQADMETMAAAIIEHSDEANETNEEANEEIEKQKTNFDMYRESYEALKAKAESGEPLTEEEKALYQELIKYMTESGELITETQENATDKVGELYEDMGTYQEGYDYAVETMGEVEGTTDFAASFDSTTQNMCYVEAGAQALNAASGGKASAKAFKLASAASVLGLGAAVYYAAGVAGALGAARSTVGSGEQLKWAGEVGDEIDLRKDTQDFNTETMDVYTEEIDAYDGWMQGVEDLELEMPDDLETPEDPAIPVTAGDGTPEGTPEPIKPNKKEEEK